MELVMNRRRESSLSARERQRRPCRHHRSEVSAARFRPRKAKHSTMAA